MSIIFIVIAIFAGLIGLATFAATQGGGMQFLIAVVVFGFASVLRKSGEVSKGEKHYG